MSRTSRRSVIKSLALSPFVFSYVPNLFGAKAPSNRVRVAHIGVNGMGTAHIKWFSGLEEVDVVGLCDLDSKHLSKAAKKLEEWQSLKPSLHDDFREVLGRNDIDAITCATPDHWHAQVAILAFQAGKDVYGEKPLSYTVKEGEMMLAAKEKNSRIFQLGTQIHAGDNYHRVAEIIQSGAIGDIQKVDLWKTGKPPVFNKASYQVVPENLNWDFWQGPAPERKYHPERCHFNYRYFSDYSHGVFQDFWCHIADVVWMSSPPGDLKNVSARGKVSEGIGDTPESIEIDYNFEKFPIHWSSEAPNLPGVEGKSIGAYFHGTKGTLVCNYSSMEIRINGEVMKDIATIPKTIVRSPGHQQNFIDSVKNRNEPESHLAYAKEMTEPMHLGIISWKLGRPLKWDANKSSFQGDNEANSMLHRPYRRTYNWI